MKIFTACVLVSLAAICAACATPSNAPRWTLASHPESGRDYPGYKRLLVDGQVRYCYAQGSGSDKKAVCLTEAQVQQAQLNQAQMVQNGTRPPTPNLNSQQAAIQLQQNFATLPPQYSGQR